MIHLRTAWRHIRRSPYQSMTAILSMSVTFFVAAVFILSALASQIILSNLERKPQITAFFSDYKSEESIQKLDEKVKETGKVENTVYVSKEEAFNIYKEQYKNDPLLLEMVSADILPSSLEISAKDPRDLEDLAKILNTEDGVEDVVYQKDLVESLISWTQAIRVAGIALVSVLGLQSVLVLWMVIGMKIALKSVEIEVVRLLGGTNWYIRWPFLLEGGLYGLIASFIAWCVSYILILYSTPILAGFLSGFNIVPVPAFFMFMLLGVMLTVGFAIGAFGSLFALFRYL